MCPNIDSAVQREADAVSVLYNPADDKVKESDQKCHTRNTWNMRNESNVL